MRVVGTFLVTVLLAAGLRAQDAQALNAGASPSASANAGGVAAATDKPYSIIVARNIFGLVAIPPPVVEVPPGPPLPKITPTGIMTLFGRLEALFRVAGTPKPGQPPKDNAHVLGEGEMVEEIEVVKIDETSRTITFNNHGTVQELPLVVAKDDAAPSPGPMNPGMLSPGIPSPNPGMGIRGGPMTPADRAAIWRNRQAALKAQGIPLPAVPNFARPGDGNNGGMATAPANSGYSSPGVQLTGGTQPQNNNGAENMAQQFEMNRIAAQNAANQGQMPPVPQGGPQGPE